MNRKTVLAVMFCCCLAVLVACSTPAGKAEGDSARFDADGTAHITRIIPMPSTISVEAQKWLDSLTRHVFAPQTLAERRVQTDKWRESQSAVTKKLFPVSVEEKTIAGVRTDVITPPNLPDQNGNRVLINLHGRGIQFGFGIVDRGNPDRGV